MPTFNDARVRKANAAEVNKAGDYVLYWMQMYRRLDRNHALDYAVNAAKHLNKPLVIYEGLKLNYPWACARFHQFILEGMRDNFEKAKELDLNYWAFVETPGNNGRGLVKKLCDSACLLVTDDFPQFIVPGHIRSIAAKVNIPVIAVDGNSVVPLSLLGPPTAAAAHLRPKWHKLFLEAWANRAAVEPEFPKSKPLKAPFKIWTPPKDLSGFVKSLPIDQSVTAIPGLVGGSVASKPILKAFLDSKLDRYHGERNKPNAPSKTASSGLSAHLHYGHLSIQEVVEETLGPDWTPDEMNLKTRNKDEFFCHDANINGFLDEAITWRDVGYQWHFAKSAERGVRSAELKNKTWQEDGETPSFNFEKFDYSSLSNGGTLAKVLPEWARNTLGKHAGDRREHLYNTEQFERAQTHDDLWNAAQTELVQTGRIHNYLRMLWAKKVLEWSESPEVAYRILEHLNNKYAIDGRDPNSYTGILWCFGLFDRPWPPERNVFGNIRYMSSDNTAKKFKLKEYLEYVQGLMGIGTGSLFG